MKIILSRKGFDSGYAGYPSPILPNGELISLPIPDFSKDIRYEDLIVSDNIRYSDIMNVYPDGIRFSAKQELHEAIWLIKV